MARPGLWLCWLVLAFGLMNVYGPRPDAISLPGSLLAQPASALETILNLQRDGRDIERYFAYANALLGRPCAAKYVQLTDEAKDGATSVAGDTLMPSRPLRPWRDFSVEYPPGMLIPITLPGLFTANFDTYFLLFSLEMEAVLTLAVALAARTAEALTPGGGRRALGLSIVLTAALGCVAVRRYDACVALAIAAVVYGMATRRPIVACVALAIGVALKGVPLLMAPALLFWFAARRDWRALAVGAASAVLCLGAVAVAYAAIAGPHALDLFRYHGDRPLQLETPYAGVLLILAPRFPDLFSVAYSYGSDNLASTVEPWLRTRRQPVGDRRACRDLRRRLSAHSPCRRRSGTVHRRGVGVQRRAGRLYEPRQSLQRTILGLAPAAWGDRRRGAERELALAACRRQWPDAGGVPVSL